MKILVVEDEPIELKLAVHVLSAGGHEVVGAEAAGKALAEIRENHPDVILLDLSLPGMDGLALARILKADPATRDIPIVAVTSYPEKFPMSEAVAAGCDAYLRKPVSTSSLPVVLSAIVKNLDGTEDR